MTSMRLALALLCAAAAFAQAPAKVTALGNLAHAAESLDKTVPFYRDTLGLAFRGGRDPLAAKPQALDADMSRFTATQGASFRPAIFDIPGAAFGLELTEFTGLARKPAAGRIQDPGSAVLSLQVKDMDAAMAKLAAAKAPIVTLGGTPVNPTGNASSAMREIIVRDPDGFLVQLVRPDPLPAAAASATGNVFAASVNFAVADTDKSVEFFKKAIDYRNRPSSPVNSNETVSKLIGLPGAEFRITHGAIGDTKADFALIEYRVNDRKPLIGTAHDPGSPAFTMTVDNIEAAVAAWKAAGGSVYTTGGTPVVRANGAGNVFVRDINGLIWEFIQRARQ